MWFRWDKGSSTCWSYSDDQVSESIQKQVISFRLGIPRKRTFTGGLKSLYSYPFNSFHSREYNLNWKHI